MVNLKKFGKHFETLRFEGVPEVYFYDIYDKFENIDNCWVNCTKTLWAKAYSFCKSYSKKNNIELYKVIELFDVWCKNTSFEIENDNRLELQKKYKTKHIKDYVDTEAPSDENIMPMYFYIKINK